MKIFYPEVLNNVEFLDGEDVRRKLGEVYGYTGVDRDKLNLYKMQLAATSNKAGNIAIVTSISHHRDIRNKIRAGLDNFMEVYLNCPVDVCAERDCKYQYKKAFTGELDNFIGVTEPYEESNNVELILDTAAMTIEECSNILLENPLSFIEAEIKEKAVE